MSSQSYHWTAEPKVVKFCTQVGYLNSSNRMTYHQQTGAWLWSRDCFQRIVTVGFFWRRVQIFLLKIFPFVVMQRVARVCQRQLSYLFRYSEILIENRRSEPTPPLFGALLGVIPSEFRRDFWHRKTRIHGLSSGIVCVILGSARLVQCRRVTDGWRDVRTDGRIHNYSICRACIASRGKNCHISRSKSATYTAM